MQWTKYEAAVFTAYCQGTRHVVDHDLFFGSTRKKLGYIRGVEVLLHGSYTLCTCCKVIFF